ncbi:hypothetical protein ACHAWF_010180 [Thalassiosira exigua]
MHHLKRNNYAPSNMVHLNRNRINGRLFSNAGISCNTFYKRDVPTLLLAILLFYSSVSLTNRMTTKQKPVMLEGIRGTPLNYTEDLDLQGIRRRLGCDKIFKRSRPITSQDAWTNARNLYKSIVGNDSTMDVLYKEHAGLPNGFEVPIEVREAPPKGRGLFALEDIKAGTRIWSAQKTARFRTGESFRAFVFRLETTLACDVTKWAYVFRLEGRERRVTVDMDEESYCNDARYGASNIGCDEERARNFKGGCRENDFARRDIKAGEELLCDYSEFVDHSWDKFGL